MTSASVTVRPADATIDEGLLFARYLNMAADGRFERSWEETMTG